MRIEKFHLKESLTKEEGISPIELNRLGEVVALVGKNGSGKSRILKLLEKSFIPKINLVDIRNDTISNLPDIVSTSIKATIKSNYDKIITLDQLLNDTLEALEKNPNAEELQDIVNSLNRDKRKLKRNYRETGKSYELARKAIADVNQVITQNLSKYFRRITYQDLQELKETIDEASKNVIDLSFEQLIDKVSQTEEANEIISIHKTALRYLSNLPNELVHAKLEAEGDLNQFESSKSYRLFSSLKKYLDIFLHKELNWEKVQTSVKSTAEGIVRPSKGLWKLNGREFNYNELSEGEKTLFTFGLLFFLLDQNPNVRIRECIIVIDEPELHLHPEAQLEVIDRIREVIKEKGQLWIATHSVNILASLNFDEIFMVKDGVITSPRRTTPGQALNELMGLEVHIDKLGTFILDISDWAYLNFMTQCFNHPDTIRSANPNDPEIILFKRGISSKIDGSVLLDFGAGKGRLYKEFSKDLSNKSKFKYYALEPDDGNVIELQQQGLQKIFKDYKDLPEATFDYIVLCNVLHEIPIEDWVPCLNRIKWSLKDDGIIILIEDLLMPKGEKIGKEGFLVLDLDSLRELFSMTDIPPEFLYADDKYKDRILCGVLKKNKISEVSEETVLKAFTVLRENCLKKIAALRNVEPTQKNRLALGRESAFLSQLYINTLLAEKTIKKSGSKLDSSTYAEKQLS